MAHNTQVTADHNAPPITRILAEFVAGHPSHGWDDAVDEEAKRTIYNWAGCAIGASRHPTMEAALAAVKELQPAPQAGILGRSDRVDIASAALLNGISSHTFDFDDTHLRTIIHPAGPVVSAALALAEHRSISGRELIDATVLGIDVSCRVGNMIYPDHYDRGWHITGSTGMLGAAAACARLLKLDVEKTQMALGIAASQPTGVREQFGTMTKPFHPGAAARAGLMAAMMARHGYTASARAIEAPRGLAQTFSMKNDWTEITVNLGSKFEISTNTYKPFACGIVIHPSIDGCVQVRNAHQLTADQIESIELVVHSLVLELTGKKTPSNGLEGKFSVYHSAAAGIIFGRAGEDEYSDEIVRRADVIALRDRVRATRDDSIAEDAAIVRVKCFDGRTFEVKVEHAIGSMERPLRGAALELKFHGLVDPVLGALRADALLSAFDRLQNVPNAAELVALTQ